MRQGTASVDVPQHERASAGSRTLEQAFAWLRELPDQIEVMDISEREANEKEGN